MIVFGAFMGGLDASLVNVGVDTIGSDLHAAISDTQWVSNGYLIAFAVSLPACGWIGRRVGVGRLWLVALAGFTISSGLCALAPTVGWLIALRVLQGLTAGLLIPGGQTILGQAVGPARLGQVMATLGAAVGVAGDRPRRGRRRALARVVAVAVPDQPAARSGRALARTQVRSTRGRRRRGAPLRRTDPVLDLRLFRNPAYSAAITTAACTGAALFGAGLLYPLYFQPARGQGVLATGLLLISMSVGTAVVMPFAGRLVDRFGGGIVSVAGGVATVATTLPFALLDTAVDGLLVQVLLVLRGMALALAVMPAATAAYKAVTREQLPDATTQVNILQRVGGALGGSIFAVVLAAGLTHGVEGAFHTTFWWLTGASALGLVTAVWLAATERRAGDRHGSLRV